ncbi:uncharacterized protein LOC135119796 isoform X2 [Zophobas morio]|uniref:uncharacterized protein LOC135119796 isoform X2 n=1 Tax=Zophobas morio TaxID=2755281 RepID=UPI0030838688
MNFTFLCRSAVLLLVLIPSLADLQPLDFMSDDLDAFKKIAKEDLRSISKISEGADAIGTTATQFVDKVKEKALPNQNDDYFGNIFPNGLDALGLDALKKNAKDPQSLNFMSDDLDAFKKNAKEDLQSISKISEGADAIGTTATQFVGKVKEKALPNQNDDYFGSSLAITLVFILSSIFC